MRDRDQEEHTKPPDPGHLIRLPQLPGHSSGRGWFAAHDMFLTSTPRSLGDVTARQPAQHRRALTRGFFARSFLKRFLAVLILLTSDSRLPEHIADSVSPGHRAK